MNNPKSMVCSPNPKEKDAFVKRMTVHCTSYIPVSFQVLGWVSLITVAGVSFYFAKQSINERRRQQDVSGERPSAKLDCECGVIICFFLFFFFLFCSRLPIAMCAAVLIVYTCTGKERVAREGEVQDPQAPGKAHPITSNPNPPNPNLVGGSRVSSSTDGAT